jgi:hypothetical protein
MLTPLNRPLTLGFILLGAAACSTQQPLPLDAQFYGEKSPVAVLMAPLPQPGLFRIGQQGLLDMAINSEMTSDLGNYVEKLDVSEFKRTQTELASVLEQRGMTPVLVAEPVDAATLPPHEGEKKDFAPHDFRGLREKYHADRALFIEIKQLGFQRSYYGFVPTSDPVAILRGTAMVVDLRTNGLLWYQPLAETRPADGAWDNPPDYPGLTNALYQTMENARRSIVGVFSQ